ncbi:hypothetical protein [Leifsonia naganoensis]|uniref:NYN domain-containing protein n=1 Tax=Leifsonia naganoensis TaxID=150025 RepID=A0A853DQ62_9MICO|nr:hypothetical protein [Leifsonia naganoensis]NYK11206.1 hypothetical protein [Leifsonia naganoensis]
MRIGVYIDGYNLYYGARGICGRSTPGWRWLDLRAMVADVIAERSTWGDVEIENVTYCTARISGTGNPEGQREQDVYLRALTRSNSATRISYGTYVARVATAPLARKGSNGRPALVEPDWPIMIRDDSGRDVPGATFMASIARREEKGSDVNVASHLLIDVLTTPSTLRWLSVMTVTWRTPSRSRGSTSRSGWSIRPKVSAQAGWRAIRPRGPGTTGGIGSTRPI